MNKLFTKIATAFVGMAMAIGVGVAVSNNQKGAVQVNAGTTEISTTMTWGAVNNENKFSFTNSGDTYIKYTFGGASNIDNYSADFRMYASAWLTLSAKTGYSSTVKIKTVAITGKTNSNTNYLYYNATTGAKVTSDGDGVTSMSWSTSSKTNTADFGNGLSSVTIARATSGNQVRITSMVVTFDYTTVSVSGVEIDGDTHEVAAGEDLNLSATITPSNATNKNVTWSIDNLSPAGCATINATTGVLHGVKAGSGKVTVTTVDGSLTDTEDFTVTSFVAVESVSLNKASTTLYVGETETLEETVLPNDASNKNVNWASDAESVATVVGGVITAVAAGTAHITATSVSDGTKSASCTVTVNNRPVTSITLNKNSTSIVNGGTETLVATINPDNATIKTITWESSATNIATVSSAGVISAKAQGEAIISAKANGFVSEQATPNLIAKCTVTVTDVVTVGKKYILAAVYTDTNSVLHQEFLSGVFYADNGKSGYGERTSFTVAPKISCPIEIVNGSTSGTYGLKLSNNKYLGYYADGTINANHLRALDDLDSKTSWTITVSGDNFNIAPSDAASRTIRYNGTSGQERFAAYTSGQNPVRLIEIDDTAYAGHFVETYMHVDIEVDDDPTLEINKTMDCKNSGWYITAKTAFFTPEVADENFHLTAAQRLEVKNSFNDYYLRLQAWAKANEEEIDINGGGTDIVLNSRAYTLFTNIADSNHTSLIIVITSLVGLTAIGGYFFIRKRKEQ